MILKSINANIKLIRDFQALIKSLNAHLLVQNKKIINMNGIIKPLIKSLTEGNFAKIVCLLEESFVILLQNLEEKMSIKVIKSLLTNYKDKKNENLVYSFYKNETM